MDDVKTTEIPQAAEVPESSEPRQFTKLGEDIGEAAPSQPVNSLEPKTDTTVSSAAETSGVTQFWKLVNAVKISEGTRLIVATVFVGLVTLMIFSLMPRRNRAAQEKPVERAVESVTPERVMAGCGQAAEDVTKDLYPMIKRTMTYKPSGKAAVALEFSRTSEENSQWVFLSMKDESGTLKYETPETQVAALPCLSSKK